MRKSIIIIMILSLVIFARGKKQINSFRNGYFTFSGAYLDYDYSELNPALKDFIGKTYDDGLYLFGGALSASLGSGISIGMQYKYGSEDLSGISSQNYNDETIGLARYNDFSLSYYGITMEYKGIFGSNLEYFTKGSANLGSMNLLISQKESPMSFNDIYNSFNPEDLNNLNRSIAYQNDLYLFEVFGGLRIFIKEGVALELSTGYLYGFGEDKGSFNYDFENVYQVPDFEFDNIIYEISLSFGK